VYPIYGGNGGGVELADLGVLFAGDLSSTKARLLLMLALTQTYDQQEIASYFEA
jgi:L-asparaginase